MVQPQNREADLYIRYGEDKEEQMIILPFKYYLLCPRGGVQSGMWSCISQKCKDKDFEDAFLKQDKYLEKERSWVW